MTLEDSLEAFPDAQELTAGLRARRVNALVFLIERRVALLASRAREAGQRFIAEGPAQERDMAFVEAFALARRPPIRPTIQDLERYAPHWAALVPDNPVMRAAVGHRLGEKYEFWHAAVPGLRAALGLDDAAVGEAYARLYGEPIEHVYTERRRLLQRLRWRRAAVGAWLEDLPPFWTAYALTLTETVGASVLALPIAVAAVGPLAGAAVLLVLGAVNLITVAFMSEAVARTGAMRYGGAFLGRLVSDYLGRGGSMLLTAMLLVFCVLILPVYYLGFAETLADATDAPGVVLVALLFVVGLHYLRRETLDATIATALLVGAINIGLIVAISLLALTHLDGDNLAAGDVLLGVGDGFEPSALALVFGVVLVAYFGHTSVAICGRLVLRRDPSGRALTRGCVAAQGTAMLLYVLFVVAVTGAVAPARLERESGTALAPLAAEVGPAIHVLGSAFVVLGMGMASITYSLALFNLVRERLPSASPRVLVLWRRRTRLLFDESRRPGAPDAARIGLVYLGPERDGPRIRVDLERGGSVRRLEAVASGCLELLGPSADAALADTAPELREIDARLSIEAIGADGQELRLLVSSTLAVRVAGLWDTAGLRAGDLIAQPEAEAALIARLMRHGAMSMPELVAHAGSDEDTVRRTLDALLKLGMVAETRAAGDRRYVTAVAPRRASRLPAEVLQAVADPGEDPAADGRGEGPASERERRLQRSVLGRRTRYAAGAAPVVAAFAAAEWMLITGSGSFAGILSFVGVITVASLAGIFPVLLVIASRHKGDRVYAVRPAPFRSAPLIAGVYVVFLAGILVHGIFIWNGLLERAGALLVGVLALVMTLLLKRRGAFAPRLTVELRNDRADGRAQLTVSAGGGTVPSEIRLRYPEGDPHLDASAVGDLPRFEALRGVDVEPRWDDGGSGRGREMKVWAHTVTEEGESEPLPARVTIDQAGERREFDLELASGYVVVPIVDRRCSVAITLRGESATDPDRSREIPVL